MTEPSAPTPPRGESPGAMLRSARQQQGLELDALAAAIKVRPDKLAALENDHYEQLPDAAFTRALAKTLCRTLKIDAAPVLAGLPASHDAARLEQVATGLNTPFRPGRREARDWSLLKRPALWLVGLLLLGAAALTLAPADWLKLRRGGGGADVAASPASAASAVVETVFPPSAPPQDGAPAPTTTTTTPGMSVTTLPTPSATAAAANLLVVHTTAESWIEVRDGTGQVLLSRALQAGETVNLDGTLPLRATIGNASATSVSFRGQPLDLRSQSRDNVARLELK